MGQVVTGLMIGAKVKPEYDNEDGDFLWYGVYPGPDPQLDEGGKFFGYFYAISRGELEDCALLEDPIPLPDLAGAYPEERRRAEEKWAAFCAWFKDRYKAVPPPIAYTLLTQIEVA